MAQSVIHRLTGISGLVSLLLPCLALARSQDVDWCNGTNVDQRIVGCTALYELGQYTGHQLAAVLNQRGRAYMGKKDYDKAIADFDEVLRLDPNNANALNDRGETYIYKQSYQRAFEDYDELTQVAPKNWRGFNGRGVARHLLGNDAAKSISDYQRASQLNPSHPWPWINLCEAHITLDQTALALEECAKANELAASPIGFFGLGIAHLKRRELGPAITAFDEALKIHPTYAKALYGRGLAKKGSGGSSEGERDIAGALSIDPNVAKEIAKFGIKP